MTSLNLASFAPKSFDEALLRVLETAQHEGRFVAMARGALASAITFLSIPKCGKDETVSAENELRLAPVFDEYIVGRIMGDCGIAESDARLQLSLSPYFFAAPAKNSDKNRTEKAQRVVNSARVSIVKLRKLLGLPGSKSARAPRPEGNTATSVAPAIAHGSSAPTAASALEVPHVSNRANGLDWLKDIDKKLATFSGTNAAHLPLSIKEAIVNLHKAIEAECDPRAAQIAALQEQLAKLLKA